MPLQIETQPFQFNNTVTGLSSAVFNSVSATSITGGNSKQWDTAYQSVSSQPYTLIDSTSSIRPKRGNNTASAIYSSVGGGKSNTASAVYSVVGGGGNNQATGVASNVSGGLNNCANYNFTSIAGGLGNCVTGDSSTIGGGAYNKVVSANRSVIAGGLNNTVSSFYSNVGGGLGNNIDSGGYYSVIAGGTGNKICINSTSSTINGGDHNILLPNCASIGGGDRNRILNNGWWSGIGSGCGNVIYEPESYIASGICNTNSGYSSFIGSGVSNTVAIPNQNLTSYWKLDESGTGTRYSSHGPNDLIQHNTISSTTGRIGNGIIGNTTGWLSTTSTVNLSGEFTINYWTIPTYNPNIQQFAGQGYGSLSFNVTYNHMYYGVPNAYYLLYVNIGSPTNAWTMATLTRDINGRVRMYHNGVYIGYKLDNTNYTNIYGVLAQPNGAFASSANGVKMDELGIWYRPLSEAEITFLYNKGNGVTYPYGNDYNLTTRSSVIAGGQGNYIGSNCSFIAAGSNNCINLGLNNSFVLGSNITALSANYTYINSLEVTNTPSIIVLKDSTGKRWKVGVDTSGNPVGLGAA
jgi:hypothetical protein